MIEAILFDLGSLVESWDAVDVTLYPDVPLMLLPLRERCALGVISRNAAAPEVLARVGLSHLFDAVLTVPDKEDRPGRRDFQRALGEMRAEAGETLYVAGNTGGVAEAMQVGLKVAVTARQGAPDSLPEGCVSIQSLEELPGLLTGG